MILLRFIYVNAPLSFKVGSGARKIIMEDGLGPDLVDAMAGAAGGPKWLVLAAMDRLMFGEWFSNRSRPLPLVGASIGSWRFAAVSQADPLAGIDRLEDLYIEQSFSEKPDYHEVTETARRIVAELLGEKGANEILNHPWARLHIVTALCKWGTGHDGRLIMTSAYAAAVATNTLSRPALSAFMERHIFADTREGRLPVEAFPGFRTRLPALSSSNLPDALLASGSIPFVMESVRIPEQEGWYRDGGMVDYHMDLPLSKNGLVLMTHFSKALIPGWLDKFVPWRRPKFLNNTLIIHPSDEWIATLPNAKIPDRTDFTKYGLDHASRVKDWREVVRRSEELAEFLAERLQRQDWEHYLEEV